MNLEEKQNLASNWFRNLRDQICAEFEKIEEEYQEQAEELGSPLFKGGRVDASAQRGGLHESNPLFKGGRVDASALASGVHNKFVRKNWNRDNNGEDGGSGEMSLMKGNVFEKVGVNFSKVYGEFSEEFRGQIPGAKENPNFWASGISLVAHMRSPLVPAVHMNTRFICTSKTWFGGGGDLNPMYEVEEDTKDFHQAFKTACDKADPSYYEKYKKWCDEYFFIKHRNVSRGVGGIFYDYLNTNDFDADFNFTKDVGLSFLDIYPKLVRRHMFEKWSDEQREHQLRKRGLYTEFNLVHDRGTKFGLMTGGNTEAILMSLPPVAKWD